jgi:hypothetical protein
MLSAIETSKLAKDSVDETIDTVNSNITSQLNLSTFARTFFKISATTLSVAFASLVGFVVYRSTRHKAAAFHQSRSVAELQEPNICRAKLTAEQIEEVRLAW